MMQETFHVFDQLGQACGARVIRGHKQAINSKWSRNTCLWRGAKRSFYLGPEEPGSIRGQAASSSKLRWTRLAFRRLRQSRRGSGNSSTARFLFELQHNIFELVFSQHCIQ